MNEEKKVMELEAEQPAYKLRALKAKDVFLMSKIIGSIGIDKMKDCFQSDAVQGLMQGEKNASLLESAGAAIFFDLANVILNHLSACEKDLYVFLAGLSGLDKNEIASLPMNTFLEMLMDVIRKEEFRDFIKVVSRLLK